MSLLLALGLATAASGPHQVQSHARPTVRIERAAVATKDKWVARSEFRRREIRKTDKTGGAYLIRIIDYE